MAAWSAGAVSVAGFVAAWVLAARNRDLADITANFGPDRFLVVYAVAGTVVASRRRSNPIGWLMLGIGLVEAARSLAGEYALDALTEPSHSAAAVWAVWLVNWSLLLLFPGGVITFLLLLFPDGRPVTRRWWAVGWLAVGLGVFDLLITWFDPGPISLGPGLPSVPNPTGVQGWIHTSRASPFGNGAWFLGWLVLVLAAASAFVRYRRSAGEQRLQLKWFAYAAALTLSLLLVLLPLAGRGKTAQLLFDAAVVAGFGVALPVAIGTAILKYRLYAIDRIISRTVSYALVTGLVVGVYLGCIVLLTKVLPVRGSVGVAASVLAAAALVNPVRRRLQAAVDRRFDRARYDADRVVAEFSVRLSNEVDLDVLGADLLGVVHQVLAPAQMTLWLAEPGTAGRPPVTRAGDQV